MVHRLSMTVRRTITVSITPEQDALLRSCISSGRFANASEVVRAALRLLDRDETTLRQQAAKLTAREASRV